MHKILCRIHFCILICYKGEKNLDPISYCAAHLVAGLELIFGGTMLDSDTQSGPVFITLTLIHGRSRAQCRGVWPWCSAPNNAAEATSLVE